MQIGNYQIGGIFIEPAPCFSERRNGMDGNGDFGSGKRVPYQSRHIG
jgi:hypothetical protein